MRVSREGKWWMVAVPEFAGVTHARRLSDVDAMAQSLIAAHFDVAPGSFDLDVQLEAIEDVRVTEIIDGLASSRAELEAAQVQYRERLRSDARRLAAKGVPMRDIGQILGVSFQRAQQLLDVG